MYFCINYYKYINENKYRIFGIIVLNNCYSNKLGCIVQIEIILQFICIIFCNDVIYIYIFSTKAIHVHGLQKKKF